MNSRLGDLGPEWAVEARIFIIFNYYVGDRETETNFPNVI